MLLAGCGTAPRDNPNDPLSPDYNDRGNLLVRVQSYFPPHSPLAGATVLLRPGNILSVTANDGTCLFTNLPEGTYNLLANKSGFAPDSLAVVVERQKTPEAVFRLNALPTFAEASVRSEHISRWFPVNLDLFRLVVSADVRDGDGIPDLVVVRLLSASSGELGELARREATERYELILKDSDLPNSSLFDLVGDRLHLEAVDRQGAVVRSEAIYVTRVIEATPVAESPAGLATTGPRPRFAWRKVTAPFRFTFRVDISQFDPTQQFATLFHSISEVDPDSLTLLSNRELPEGDYYWTVSIVDAQGNLSRSKEAPFRVQ